jgi:hypothetical protein
VIKIIFLPPKEKYLPPNLPPKNGGSKRNVLNYLGRD